MKDEKCSSDILKKTSSPRKTVQGKNDDENGKTKSNNGFKNHMQKFYGMHQKK